MREALDPGVRRARGGLGGRVRTPGMGRGFRATQEGETFRDEGTRGVRVQRVAPGGALDRGVGGKGPNTLGWITVRPGLARLRVGRGSGGPSRKGGVDRGSAGRSGCSGLCEVTAGGGVGLLGRARQRKVCVCLGDSALSAGIGDRGGGWVWGKW